MKSIVIGCCSCILLGILVLIIYTLHGRSIRYQELNNAMFYSMETALDKVREGGLPAPKTDRELEKMFRQRLLTQIKSNSDVTVNVLAADCEKGLLSAEAVLTYRHPVGTVGTVSVRRTAVIEKTSARSAAVRNRAAARTTAAYTNAKEFYDSTQNQSSHVRIVEGDIYFATCGKEASLENRKRYTAAGFDICLEGNGRSVEMAVKRGETLREVAGSEVMEKGYLYKLYRIAVADIYRLASHGKYAGEVLGSEQLQVTMDAILVIKEGDSSLGNIEEDGRGNVTEEGMVLHLKKDADWRQAMNIFSGHDFESYRNIQQQMQNYTLQISYQLDGGIVSGEYDVKNDVLYQNGMPVLTEGRLLQQMALIHPKSIGLSKDGYYLKTGEEWICEGSVFSGGAVYMPRDICPEAGLRERRIVMCANWKKIPEPEAEDICDDRYVRFISERFWREKDTYVSREQGGLEEDSVWKTEEYREELERSLRAIP